MAPLLISFVLLLSHNYVDMDKASRRHDCHHQKVIIYDDEIFERMEEGRRLEILFIKLFLVMMSYLSLEICTTFNDCRV